MNKQQATAEYTLPKSICTCGHIGDHNVEAMAPEELSMHAGVVGHGKCTEPGCNCERFSWSGWTDVFEHYIAQFPTDSSLGAGATEGASKYNLIAKRAVAEWEGWAVMVFYTDHPRVVSIMPQRRIDGNTKLSTGNKMYKPEMFYTDVSVLKNLR